MIAEKSPPKEEQVVVRERRRRLRRREARRGTRCLNCDASTEARYCPECGQENVDVNISIWEIFREAVEEFVRFDSKLVRTLVPLVTKPGKLTKEWAAGRRTKYLSPLKLYLTITAIFFLLLSLVNTGTMVGTQSKVPPKVRYDSRQEFAGLPEPLHFVAIQLEKLDHGIDNRELKDQFMGHAPTALFLMLPAFAGALWVLYLRNRRYYVEHLVFALHCHAYYFLVLTLLTVIPTGNGLLWGRVVAGIVLATTPLYSLIALKANYGQGWGKTIVKSLMLGWAYVVLLGITMFGCLIAAAASMPDPWESLPAQAAKKPVKSPSPTESKAQEGAASRIGSSRG